MYIRRNFDIKGITEFTGFHILWLSAYGALAVFLYHTLELSFLAVPSLAVSLIGTAVAFYVGFKNNSSYDRLWEARKIWGAIVNDSRSFAVGCKNLIADTEGGNKEVLRKLMYRHIGWLYTLRAQLLKPAPWEHIQGNLLLRLVAQKRIRERGTGLYSMEANDRTLVKFLDSKEFEDIHKVSNMATHLLDWQSKTLADLNKNGDLNDFQHINLQETLYRFYDHQGKNERIKNYPFPRQYASMSFYFVGIFILILPFGLMPLVENTMHISVWWSALFSVLVSWVFLMMELVGDYSENPFEGMVNDIPMLSICRTIEIDLREMLGETDIPPKIEPKNDVLM